MSSDNLDSTAEAADESSSPSRVDENTPLLRASSSRCGIPREDEGAHNDATGTHRTKKAPHYPYVIILVFLLSFVADVGGSLVDTPEIQLLEMAVCRYYYRQHDPRVIGEPPLSYIDERLCKRNEIQAELAYVRALKSLLMTIPGKRQFHQSSFH